MAEREGVSLNILNVKDAGDEVVDVQFRIDLPSGNDVLRWFRRGRCLSCRRYVSLSTVVSCSGPVLRLDDVAAESYSASLKVRERASMADVLDILNRDAKCTIAKVLTDYTTRRLSAGGLVEESTSV
ncbi:MAG: hypothetical protein UY27_C0005G0017 [Candidatus Gottesmanbacteria bacterium GW2011_GWA1_48_13]|uniref:Uncharacterized protein n=1 Tax=Candidatus Gottesmanbacteria bacterium GW2011_GWA1_48_13 TaxID=1618439 RepID=A0A0G1XNW9_9BACT|nr:MAG: hypothetical protein UY27_C0005G0017 [Candidatus Gottesmanbacteria bacterium GW2011_GWA1_48_13]